MSVTFQLDRPSATKSSIMLTYRNRGFRFRHSVGFSVAYKNWDVAKGRVKSGPDKDTINDHIVRLSNVFQECVDHYRLAEKRLPTYAELKDYCNTHYTKRFIRHEPNSKVSVDERPAHELYVVPFFQRTIDTWRTNGRIKKNSIKVYQRTVNILRDAIGDAVSIAEFNRHHIEMFVTHMRSKSAMDNYIKKAMDNIKTLVKHMDSEFNLSDVVDKIINPRSYGLKSKPKDTIYLSDSELERLSNYDFSDHPRLDAVKDIFLFACYTGLRYSDVSNVSQWQIVSESGKDWLHYRQVKTEQPVKIPLKSEAKRILEKYPNGLPRKSNQEINRCLKEIGQLVGLTEPVKITEFRNGAAHEYTKHKYEMLTSHTARRTFCTLAYRAGVPAHTIMAFSGHASESSFRRYLRYDMNDAMKDGSTHNFFI